MSKVGRPPKFHGSTSRSTQIKKLIDETKELISFHGKKYMSFVLSLVSLYMVSVTCSYHGPEIVNENLKKKFFIVF